MSLSRREFLHGALLGGLALRLPPGDADVTKLSGGERRRVALCKLLLMKPDLLLLDEPTNHLDAESVAWLERHLKEYAGSVILVTHDRYFLDNVVGWILENRKIRQKMLFMPYYFVSINYAAIRGIFRYYKGKQTVNWERAQRANS